MRNVVLDKTKTIKDRLIYVYLPSQTMVENWRKHAKQGGVSLSKFVMEHVENGIERENKEFVPRVKIIEQVKKLEEENEDLRRENTHLNIVIDKLQADIQKYRLEPFLKDNFDGMRKYNRDLIQAFKKKGFIKTSDLWREVGVDLQEMEGMKVISQQLQTLEAYGLIKKTREGWRWQT